MSAMCQRGDSALLFKKPFVQFMNHSGFIVAGREATLVLDYYTDPEAALSPYLESELPLIFMVTHEHYDHWNPDILQWHSKTASVYLLDEACRAYFRQNPYELNCKKIAFIKAGTDLRDLSSLALPFEKFRVFSSTDAGSSFFFRMDEQNYFHAGDLNNWDWQDEDSPAMEAAYLGELEKLRAYLCGENLKLDVAFVPVDGRLADKALLGAEQFIRCLQPKYLLPMHLNGGLEFPGLLAKSEYGGRCKVINLSRPGDRIDREGVRIPPCLEHIY